MSLPGLPAIRIALESFDEAQRKALRDLFDGIKRNDDALAAQFPLGPSTVTAGTTINAGNAGVLYLNYAAGANVTNLTGGMDGQVVRLVNVSGAARPTLKIHATGKFFLVGGIDFTFGAGMGNNITLLYLAAQSAWFELSRAAPA